MAFTLWQRFFTHTHTVLPPKHARTHTHQLHITMNDRAVSRHRSTFSRCLSPRIRTRRARFSVLAKYSHYVLIHVIPCEDRASTATLIPSHWSGLRQTPERHRLKQRTTLARTTQTARARVPAAGRPMYWWRSPRDDGQKSALGRVVDRCWQLLGSKPTPHFCCVR